MKKLPSSHAEFESRDIERPFLALQYVLPGVSLALILSLPALIASDGTCSSPLHLVDIIGQYKTLAEVAKKQQR